jgi:hypothetical protein
MKVAVSDHEPFYTVDDSELVVTLARRVESSVNFGTRENSQHILFDTDLFTTLKTVTATRPLIPTYHNTNKSYHK